MTWTDEVFEVDAVERVPVKVRSAAHGSLFAEEASAVFDSPEHSEFFRDRQSVGESLNAAIARFAQANDLCFELRRRRTVISRLRGLCWFARGAFVARILAILGIHESGARTKPLQRRG